MNRSRRKTRIHAAVTLWVLTWLTSLWRQIRHPLNTRCWIQFLTTMQVGRILLINARALMTQKWRLTLLNTHSVPTWAPSWYSWHIISLSLWCLGRITGCLVPSGTEACLRRPPITSRPLSNTGHSLTKRLDFETRPFCFISSISFVKFVVWARLNMSVSDSAISDTEIRSLFTCFHFRYCTNRRNQQSAFFAL